MRWPRIRRHYRRPDGLPARPHPSRVEADRRPRPGLNAQKLRVRPRGSLPVRAPERFRSCVSLGGRAPERIRSCVSPGVRAPERFRSRVSLRGRALSRPGRARPVPGTPTPTRKTCATRRLGDAASPSRSSARRFRRSRSLPGSSPERFRRPRSPSRHAPPHK